MAEHLAEGPPICPTTTPAAWLSFPSIATVPWGLFFQPTPLQPLCEAYDGSSWLLTIPQDFPAPSGQMVTLLAPSPAPHAMV